MRLPAEAMWKVMGLLILAVCMCACQSNLGYTDEDLVKFSHVQGGKELPFENAKGKQLAFYVAPREGDDPKPLIILFPGIGARALDRLDWVRACPDPRAGFLLIDYPGRGRCEGVLRPSRLASTTDGALDALAEATTISRKKLLKDVRVVGHSFGCGAALQFAVQMPVTRIVILAPFTTMKRALFRKMGPLAWLIPDNLDNRANLKTVVAQPSPPPISIIHGVLDSTIPFSMAETLKSLAPDHVTLIKIDQGTHISILTENMVLMFEKLLGE